MDPKASLLAVRLAERHMHYLQQRARRLRISLSEALRQCVDESLRAQQLGRPRATVAHARGTRHLRPSLRRSGGPPPPQAKLLGPGPTTPTTPTVYPSSDALLASFMYNKTHGAEVGAVIFPEQLGADIFAEL